MSPTQSSCSASARSRASAEVNASGADQPAIRIRLNPQLLASMGVSAEEVRQAVTAANAMTPLGAIDGPRSA